jgi:hypothetical protein
MRDGVSMKKKCVVCEEQQYRFDMKYSTLEIRDKIVCSACAEAIHYLFEKDYLSNKFDHYPKGYVQEMERRLKEKLKQKKHLKKLFDKFWKKNEGLMLRLSKR